jgi:hypothetical protein
MNVSTFCTICIIEPKSSRAHPRAEEPKSPRAQVARAQEPKSPRAQVARAQEPKSPRAQEPKRLRGQEPKRQRDQEPKSPSQYCWLGPKSRRAQESTSAQEPVLLVRSLSPPKPAGQDPRNIWNKKFIRFPPPKKKNVFVKI